MPAVSLDLIPKNWLPPVTMKRIHNHWTAGSYHPSEEDLEHYHFVIDGDGFLHRGAHSISANIPPIKEGGYAAHTKGANSYAIGNSLCCMRGAKERPLFVGDCPMRKIQWDALVRINAQQALFYKIPVTDKTILSHAEVQVNLGIKQNAKWDYTVLAFDLSISGAKAIGDRFRAEVRAAMK